MDKIRYVNELMRNTYKDLVGKSQAKKACRKIGMDGRIMLNGSWGRGGCVSGLGSVCSG
jgi:hypothetical protein